MEHEIVFEMSEKKKVAWITGCSRGLGAEMVKGLQAEGWLVAGCARDVATSPSADFLRSVDVIVREDVEAFCRDACEEVGAPDLLLNNAAVINSPGSLWEVAADDFDCLLYTSPSPRDRG